MNAARLLIAPPTTAARAKTTPALRQIRNAKVRGDELLEAVAFLAGALNLPALRVDSGVDEDTTVRCGNVIPLHRRR